MNARSLSKVFAIGAGLMAAAPVLACDGDDEETSVTVDDIPSISCNKQAECNSDYFSMYFASVDDCVTTYEAYIEQYSSMITPGCQSAVEDLWACLSPLGCSDFDAWSEGDPDEAADYPCKSNDLAVDAQCDSDDMGTGHPQLPHKHLG